MSTKTSKEKCKCVQFPNSNLYDVSNCKLHNTFTKVKEAKQVGEKVAICLDCHTAYYEWLSESNQCPACEGRIAVYDCLKRVTPKVATSEKEWTCPCGKPAQEFDTCSKECEEKYTTKDTPPESEDKKEKKYVTITEIWQSVGKNEQGQAMMRHMDKKQDLKLVALLADGKPIKLEKDFYLQNTYLSPEEFKNKFPQNEK